MYRFLLMGETIPKKNSRINLKNGISIPSKRYKEWHENAKIQINRYIDRPPVPIDYPVEITLSFTHGDLRHRDSDNGTSSILDLLQDCSILNNDDWQTVRKINIENSYEHGAPSVIIQIKKYEA